MKTILFPTDFSDPGVPAYRFAVDLAEKINAEILVAHVVELPLYQETTFGIQPMTTDPEFVRQAGEKAEAAFRRLSERHRARIPVRFVSLTGNVVRSLASLADEKQVDLVIMSPRGEGAADDFFAGSLAGKMARNSPAPILFVPGEVSVKSIRSIVFPTTLELDQPQLLMYINALQEWFDAVLHVLLVCTPLHFWSHLEAKTKLENFARFYELKNFTLNTRNHPRESAGIQAFLEEIDGDMLAMSTHGRKGLAHLLQGSTAESLVYTTHKPVWTWKIK